ncbi:hypothetical protein I3843_10G155300 [Carya illinoinensis]|uniref:Reverse transcriptase zinc-binding domain-containing protein n=1 Tax=Carya illinoinensis TaxID=32201 RepID=A0A922DZS0_CARIL|nr:hypothetical protein I3760_10G163300 [Carya illinoinensis]KAG6693266.1 hypothetical protein I3842_10G160700 [Carya illinoinensis]KAG7960969.1 hypothetical protein I3843_10G155300 [Carya illinoinensis]
MMVVEWCFMCKKAGESVDHLLFHCDAAKGLWEGVIRRIGLTWVMPKSVTELLACWPSIHSCSQVAAAWKMIPLCILCIWLEMNERCFNNREHSVDDLWNFLFLFLFFPCFLGFQPLFLMVGQSMSFCFHCFGT